VGYPVNNDSGVKFKEYAKTNKQPLTQDALAQSSQFKQYLKPTSVAAIPLVPALLGLLTAAITTACTPQPPRVELDKEIAEHRASTKENVHLFNKRFLLLSYHLKMPHPGKPLLAVDDQGNITSTDVDIAAISAALQTELDKPAANPIDVGRSSIVSMQRALNYLDISNKALQIASNTSLPYQQRESSTDKAHLALSDAKVEIASVVKELSRDWEREKLYNQYLKYPDARPPGFHPTMRPFGYNDQGLRQLM